MEQLRVQYGELVRPPELSLPTKQGFVTSVDKWVYEGDWYKSRNGTDVVSRAMYDPLKRIIVRANRIEGEAYDKSGDAVGRRASHEIVIFSADVDLEGRNLVERSPIGSAHAGSLSPLVSLEVCDQAQFARCFEDFDLTKYSERNLTPGVFYPSSFDIQILCDEIDQMSCENEIVVTTDTLQLAAG